MEKRTIKIYTSDFKQVTAAAYVFNYSGVRFGLVKDGRGWFVIDLKTGVYCEKQPTIKKAVLALVRSDWARVLKNESVFRSEFNLNPGIIPKAEVLSVYHH